MNIPVFRLYRMGSDPEALFVKPVDFDYIITPAYDIIGRDKKKTTTSFIGTDNRPVLAEIRPNPSRNLKRHLYEIAYAVCAMQDFLDSSVKFHGHKILAYPHVLGENLGGHIHASMFVNDPLYLRMKNVGVTFGTGGHYIASLENHEPTRAREIEDEILKAIQARSVVTPTDWAASMGYLLSPFEKWVQPWVPREQRNASYGNEANPDIVRLGTSRAPYLHPWAYVHWEYRLPSTWLQHPWLAYAYLGLAKLQLLNMQRVLGFWQEGLPAQGKKKKPALEGGFAGPGELVEAPLTHFTSLKAGDPAEAGRLLKTNLERLMPGARISKDLNNLLDIVARCGAKRIEWFSKPQPVDVEAWRRLL